MPIHMCTDQGVLASPSVTVRTCMDMGTSSATQDCQGSVSAASLPVNAYAHVYTHVQTHIYAHACMLFEHMPVHMPVHMSVHMSVPTSTRMPLSGGDCQDRERDAPLAVDEGR